MGENSRDTADIVKTYPSYPRNMETEFKSFVKNLPFDDCRYVFYQMTDWKVADPIFIYWVPDDVQGEDENRCDKYRQEIEDKIPHSLSIDATRDTDLDFVRLQLEILLNWVIGKANQ